MMIKNGNLLKLFAGGDFFSKFPIQVNVEILPDPSITVEDMIDYGYSRADVLPLNLHNARRLHREDLRILFLFEDNTERICEITDLFDGEYHSSLDGIFGIYKGDWYEYLENKASFMVLEDLWDSETAEVLDPEQFPDALAPIAPEFPEPPEHPFLYLNEMENEFGVDHVEYGENPFDW
jgi:hypothetical protein